MGRLPAVVVRGGTARLRSRVTEMESSVFSTGTGSGGARGGSLLPLGEMGVLRVTAAPWDGADYSHTP